jgi:hypothetical protein
MGARYQLWILAKNWKIGYLDVIQSVLYLTCSWSDVAFIATNFLERIYWILTRSGFAYEQNFLPWFFILKNGMALWTSFILLKLILIVKKSIAELVAACHI